MVGHHIFGRSRELEELGSICEDTVSFTSECVAGSRNIPSSQGFYDVFWPVLGYLGYDMSNVMTIPVKVVCQSLPESTFGWCFSRIFTRLMTLRIFTRLMTLRVDPKIKDTYHTTSKGEQMIISFIYQQIKDLELLMMAVNALMAMFQVGDIMIVGQHGSYLK